MKLRSMKFILLQVLLVIVGMNCEVYLKRHRRIAENSSDKRMINENNLPEIAVKTKSGAVQEEITSGMNSGSGLGSGLQSLFQIDGNVSHSSNFEVKDQISSGESEQIDAVFEKLMNENEDGSASGGLHHTEAVSRDDMGNTSEGSHQTEALSSYDASNAKETSEADAVSSGMSGTGSGDGFLKSDGLEAAEPILDMKKDAKKENDGGFENFGSSGGKTDSTISRRSLEASTGMALLQEFFDMNSNVRDTSNNVQKRNVDDNEAIESEYEAKGKEDIEVKMRKRSVEDLGDETIPNFSYIKNNVNSGKIEKLEDEGKITEKRSVVDADNSVRFLSDVMTRDLLSEKEAKMIERITRGVSDEHSVTQDESHDVERRSRETIANNRELREEISRETSKQDSLETSKQQHRFQRAFHVETPILELKSEPETNHLKSSVEDELPRKITKRDAILGPDIRTRHYQNARKRQFEDATDITVTIKGIRNKRREILDNIPVQTPNFGVLQKRDLILDSDADADIFMATAGKTKHEVKEKRHIRVDDSVNMWRRPSRRFVTVVSDKITDLTPLNNEYLENLKKHHSLMKKTTPKQNTGIPLIGTFAKPTEVVGTWSGLGSEPVFIEKQNREESGSGSGSDADLKADGSGDDIATKKLGPEDVGKIMGHDDGMKIKTDKSQKSLKSNKKNKNSVERKRGKRMDKEEDRKYDVNLGTSQVVLAFDEVHEIVPKRGNTKRSYVPTTRRGENRSNTEQQRRNKKRKNAPTHKSTKTQAKKDDKQNNKDWNEDRKDSDEEDWDESSSDEESGDGETEKHIRSDTEDDVTVKTLSAKYKKNEDIDKRDIIIIKRAPDDNGYLGCFVDVLNPVRDLSVRAGIPFVTINNCRSACKRTGYYYAGLQFGYLCFCGNTYGKYDMAPDSECNYQCSGNLQQTCGGLWRNSIYSTAGSPDESKEGPVPIYLSAHDKASQSGLNATNTRRSEIPDAANTTTTTSAITNTTNAYPQFQEIAANNTLGSQNSTGVSAGVDAEVNNASGDVKIEGGKRKVLMHFAYLHPQHEIKLEPTSAPLPTPPLRIEPQTRVFKGEVKLKQKWFDQFKDKMSAKSLILAGNVEQALRNIYTNNSQFHDFLKAEVLSFREGIIKNNPGTITKVVVEFALTFNQNAISPDARLFSTVRAKKRLDEMPVYPSTLKVSEYRFDPNSPNQAFKVPSKESTANSDYIDSDDEKRKSFIASQPTANGQPQSDFQSLNGNEASSQGIKELQNYLSGESNGPMQGKNAAVDPSLEEQLQQETGAERQNEGTGNGEMSKRSQIQNMEESRKKVPYILRLFFWKDMLARKKRRSPNDALSRTPLTRARRGDLETTTPFYDDNNNNDDKKSKRNRLNFEHESSQRPLTEEASFERRLSMKTKRRTKDLSTEKELKRSKRRDPESEFD